MLSSLTALIFLLASVLCLWKLCKRNSVQPSKRFLRSAGPRHNSLKIVGSVVFPENSSVHISPAGTLILRHFNLSGIYTCSIVYKLTAMQPDKNLVIKYLIYAYSDPRNYCEFTAQYHAAPCNSSHNTSFEKALLPIAKHLIEAFFKQQVEVSRKSSELLPEIFYIEGTLQMVWVDRCYPGYAMNALIHPDCPECCVVCSPGSYNPGNGIHCLRCDRSLIYGATKC